MEDRNIKTLKGYVRSRPILQGDELDEVQFDPNVYQRLFVMDDATRRDSRAIIDWLWDRLRRKGFAAGNSKGMAIIAYPLTEDFKHWELFANVSGQMARTAIEHSNDLMQSLDSLNRAITIEAIDRSAYVLPNVMLVDQGAGSESYSLFLTSTEISKLGKSARKISIPRPT
jgi:hypothetical protein